MYGTELAADTYHSDRGNAAWGSATSAEKLAALVRASDYIDGRYMRRLSTGAYTSMFPGIPTGGRAQDREWPRTGASDGYGKAIDANTVPVEVENATYAAALRELATPNSLAPDFTASALVSEEAVGPLKVKYADMQKTGDMGTPNRPMLPEVDEILAPILMVVSTSLGVAMTVV